MNKLALYLNATGATQQDFAALVGTHQSTISRLMRGWRPSLALAARIAEATGGAVGVSDWLPAPEMHPTHMEADDQEKAKALSA